MELMKRAMQGKISPTKDQDGSVSPSKAAIEEKDNMLGQIRKAIHAQIGGRIIGENEVKLAQALEENIVLSKVYNDKVREKDRIFYKYAEA
jgi:hypothetical protein